MSDDQLQIVVLLRRLCAQPGAVHREQILGRCEGAALAASLHLASELNAQVTAIAVGPAKREDRVLAMALRAGCHRAFRVDLGDAAEVDYLGLASALVPAIERDRYDLVLCGERSQDELQGAVGPAVAELLDIDHLSGVVGVHVEEGLVIARQRGDGCFHTYRCALPALLAISAFRPPPRSAVQAVLEDLGESPEEDARPAEREPATGPVSVRSGTIEALRLEQLGLDAGELAHRATMVGRSRPARSGPNAMMAASPRELIARLEDDRLL